MKSRSVNSKIRAAVHRLHKRYRASPWMFMNEKEVQCWLYAELAKDFSFPRFALARKWPHKKPSSRLGKEYGVKTIPLHAELSTATQNKKIRQHPDLSILNPKKTVFDVRERRGKRRVWDYAYTEPRKAIGIEIKFGVNSGPPGAGRNLRSRIQHDIKKLKDYKRGWFIFVDQGGAIRTRSEWKNVISTLARNVTGRVPKTLNAYYLTPRFKQAMVYRHPWSSI